jgi:sigma-B regulation protein RsbU (phosphoserine phosphatase)
VRLAEGGTVLGVFPQVHYQDAEIAFAQGDRLVIVTDGITEAANTSQEQFGEDRLMSLLLEKRDMPVSSLPQLLLDAVASFTGGPLQDDATLMVVAMPEGLDENDER